MNLIKLLAFTGIAMLAPLFTINANAVNIPILDFSCTQSKTPTGICVEGYFANGWSTNTGYWRYTMNTLAFTGPITMTFNNARSTTGPVSGSVYYQTVGPEVLVGTFSATTTCSTVVFTLPAACSGKANLIVKVKMTNGPNPAGTHRIDSAKVFDAALDSSTIPCFGTPDAGLINGPTTICRGSSAALSLTGFSTNPGIVRQWQSSNDNVTFTNIPGVTGNFYTSPALQSTTYYRVGSTCVGTGLSDTTPTAIVNIFSPPVAPITGYTAPVIVGTTQQLANATPGGEWLSSHEPTASVDSITGVLSGVSGGSSIISYSVLDSTTGCLGVSSINVDVVWPNILALYAGQYGSSTNVINMPGNTTSALYDIGFGRTTPCASGGLSGLTVNTINATFNLTGPHVSYKVYPNSGNVLNMSRIHARVRVTASGPTKARIAYRYWSNGMPSGWNAEAADVPLISGTCGISPNSWDFNTGNPAPMVTGITDSLEVAVFPFAPFSSGGAFQLNTLEVYDEGGQRINSRIVIPTACDIQLFPNPATDVLYIKVNQRVHAAIYSIEGKLLIKQQNAASIDISSLARGIYHLRIYGENNVLLKTEKFTKK
jgi:hypothetical protein